MRADVPAVVTGSPIARSNWNVHAGAIALVGFAWLGVFWTHPDRAGLNGLGDGLLVFLTGALALGYAVISSIALLVVQKTPRAAWIVHGGTLGVTAVAVAALFAIR